MKFYNVLPFYEVCDEDAVVLERFIEQGSASSSRVVRFHKFSGGWIVYVLLWSCGKNGEKYYVLKL